MLVTTAPKYIALTCVFVVALAMVLSVYYLMQKRRHPDHDPLPPGEVAIRHGHGRDALRTDEPGGVMGQICSSTSDLRLSSFKSEEFSAIHLSSSKSSSTFIKKRIHLRFT